MLGQSFGPAACIECFSGSVGDREATRLRIGGEEVFTLRGFLAQLRQQQLPEL
jgi:hypothetical protein